MRIASLCWEWRHWRRQGQDLVQAFKILKEIDDVDKAKWFHQTPVGRTRATEGGHQIVRENSRLELRRNFFSQRVADKWNSLPREAKEATTVREFKYRVPIEECCVICTANISTSFCTR